MKKGSAFYKLVLIIVLCIGTQSLSAQIVNIEDKRANRADSSSWYGQINLGFNLIENGNSILNLNGGSTIEFEKGQHWVLSLTNFNFIQIEDEDFVNDGFQHVRYNYKINKFLTYEAFTQAQYNEQLNLQLRVLVGTGPRLTLLNKEDHTLHFGLSYMYEYNLENDPEMEFNDHRMSSYLSLASKIFENARLSNTTYYQPIFADFSDLRLSSQTALAINLTKRLLFTSTFSITYDSRVPVDVENTIYSLRNGIRWHF